MILTDTSIKRPVFATVISLLIITFGIAALLGLPVREYPDIDPPEVAITTDYIGAAPEVIDTQITQVIEGAISRVDGIKTIESSSELNDSRTTVEFVSGRDVDVAANDIRDAISRVADQLPEEAEAPVVTKSNADARPMIWMALQSDEWSSEQLTDFAERTLVDRLSVVSGVADVQIGGERRYAIRVWLDRERMASREVTVADIERALRANNVELPAGEIESISRKFTVRTASRLADVEQFANLVVRRQDDYQLRLGEVARVELGAEDDNTYVRANGRNAIGLGIIRQSKSNTVAISDRVREEVERIRPQLPPEVDLQVLYDESLFIRASITEVLVTLAISVALVILVIFIFLRSVRATLIPAFTIPVAIIGAFSGLAVLGFSINVLTLLAVILAIGLVVDDAIVMLENIQRRIDLGEPRLVAAYRGARQVSFAIVATTVTLVAVFVPISFMGGNVGRLFAEFGFTLAVAVIFSSIVALTLAPMLCSKWLSRSPTQEPGSHRLFTATERVFEGMTRGYRRLLDRALRNAVFTLTLGIAGTIVAFGVFPLIAQELAPTEDRGVFIVPATSPVGSTSAFTNHHVGKLEQKILPFLEEGEIDRLFSITGFRGEANRAFVIVGLDPWEAREKTQQQLVSEISPLLREVPGLRAFAVNPPGLGQSSFNQPLEVVIGGPDYGEVKAWAERLLEKARENPNLLDLDIDYEERQPQLNVQLDRDKAADLDITVEDIGLTLQTMLASRQVTRYLDRGREYDVIVQAADKDRMTPADLGSVFLRPRDGGELIPLSAIVTTEERGVPRELRRVDRLPAITLTASLAPGYDLGTALADITSLAERELPTEARISLKGLSREFSEASSAVYITFGLAFLIVFLVLAAQFESWVHPAIIMLSVPLAITGALLALWATGISLNIYSQIGMVMLLGLMAKNGILVVEFANQLRDQGYSVRDAILEGSAIRFRPILMTTISTIFGAVPLVIATGAGAESRASIGVVILGGLVFATTLTLFIIPVLYNLLARFTRSANAISKDLEREIEQIADPEAQPDSPAR
ncbi:efflux RND transporter permease subunit [Hydrocarboniclastica marina]|uniref:AcrB/AcrD/AcrF family protein n=1 Tax=Hydrocarboniclastica marina TaxID=2259620 RepID=A0A4V1D975_9ALTE|nr:efflux RND transporter permease subunit [Hydrocarboniclastica marina]MAM00451.1 multidrug transporter AcrB [Alteromonadaceae bacterium]QCF27710.1 AcrB/AcrD/AcrF family protein [Hydrocarboniclastica marina]